MSTGTVRDRLPLGPAGTLGFVLDLTRSMHGLASQQRRAHFQEQGNLEKLSKRCEYGGARSQGATRAPAGSTLDPPGPPALKNKTSPGELHLFPSSARSCLGRVGFSPQAQPCCARPPSSPSRPPMESNRMGAGGSHQADFLLAISRAPDRSRHMDPKGSVTCLWPFPLSLQHWAGYSLAPPLLILVPVSVPCRQSTTETSPSVSLNGGGLIKFVSVVKLGCSLMSTSTQRPCPDTYTHASHTHTETNMKTHTKILAICENTCCRDRQRDVASPPRPRGIPVPPQRGRHDPPVDGLGPFPRMSVWLREARRCSGTWRAARESWPTTGTGQGARLPKIGRPSPTEGVGRRTERGADSHGRQFRKRRWRSLASPD